MASTDRREFLKSAALAAGAVGLGSVAQTTRAADAPPAPAAMTTRTFGKIGKPISILGAGLGSVFTRANGDPDKAVAMCEAARKAGVTYFDTARAYGPSEKLVGPFVKQHRKDIYLVSKSADRTYDGFMRQLETSLKLLQTDHIDLYHIHNLGRRDGDLAKIEAGAVRAARKARDQGTISHFGITGHSGAAILINAINAWDPDAILTIYPASRPDNGQYEDKLLPLARKKKMGIIAMKCVRHARDADLKGSDLIRYALSLEGVHGAIVGLDTIAHLQENVAMASNFTPLDAAARHRMSEEVQTALAGHPAPWDRPGYTDAVAEA
jgi:aryl-alcohol dehydrogenase-like predicted oxidoreductase